MLIKSVMKTEVLTVSPDVTIIKAWEILRDLGIRHLPVVEGNQLVGIVSDRNLLAASPAMSKIIKDPALLNRSVGEIMSAPVITVHPLDTIDDAASLMYKYKIGSLPVVSGEGIVGIITESDLLRALTEMMGAQEPGSQLLIRMEDRPGILAEITQIFKRFEVNIISVLTIPNNVPETRDMAFKINTINPRKIVTALMEAGFEVIGPHFGGE